ncbi:MAG: hypothetical protein LBG58_06675, partial [Planctomycetaceae bacterium]|nr:hypothetical protein [Planctomycetaceae bacterium]
MKLANANAEVAAQLKRGIVYLESIDTNLYSIEQKGKFRRVEVCQQSQKMWLYRKRHDIGCFCLIQEVGNLSPKGCVGDSRLAPVSRRQSV